MGPLADFDLGDAGPPATATPPGRSRRKHDPAFDPGVTPPAGALPLFGGDAAEDLPIVPAAAPTPPLAVRRAPSPLSKPRPRPTPRPAEPQPDSLSAASGRRPSGQRPPPLLAPKRPRPRRVSPRVSRPG